MRLVTSYTGLSLPVRNKRGGPTQGGGGYLFLLLPYQQAPSGPALQDSTASAPYRAPLPLVEVLLISCAHQALNSESANVNGAPVGLLQLCAATALWGMEAVVRSTFY
jgi:hypothetical protein